MQVQMKKKEGFQGSSIKKSKEEKTELKIISWHVLGRDTSVLGKNIHISFLPRGK